MPQTTVDRDARKTWRIPPPSGDRAPLKVNIFEKMQSANSELMPLFPYYGPGAFVPCGAIFRGDPDLDMGHFFHSNTVDEIVCVYGGHQGMLQTGQVIGTPKLHGVNSFLKKPHDPASFLVLTVTQRQVDGGEQLEQMLVRCAKCHEHLLVFDFTSSPTEQPEDHFPPFPTITEVVTPMESFNGDESVRTCSKCGFVNPEFPLDAWGWKKWAVQRETVNLARLALLAAAKTDLGQQD